MRAAVERQARARLAEVAPDLSLASFTLLEELERDGRVDPMGILRSE